MQDSAIVQLFTDLSEKVDAHGRAARIQTMAEAEVINTRHTQLVSKVSFWIWTQKNYKVVVPIVIIALVFLVKISPRINLQKTIEDTTHIVIDDQVTTVERPPK